MDKKLLLRAGAVAGILAAGLFASFYWPQSTGSSPEIILPQSGGTDIELEGETQQYNHRVIDEITMDTSSVQRVVASLRRPGEYSFTGQVTYYYGDGQTGVFSVRGAVRGELCKVVQSMPDGLFKHTILTPASVYIWSSSTLSYYKGAAGNVSADELALLPTYEDLLSVPQEEIADASFEKNGEGQLCVYARRLSADGSLEEQYYIDVQTGLLTSFTAYEAGKPTYAMQLTPAVETVRDDWFTLPSGAVVTASD